MLQTKIKPLILVGCSGSGRSAIIYHLNKKYPHKFQRLISYTTRRPRQTQQNNKDFYFVDQSWIKQNSQKLVTLTYSINNHYYGLTATQISRIITKNKIPILKMTLDAYVKNIGKNSRVFINPSDLILQPKSMDPVNNVNFVSCSSLYLLRNQEIQCNALYIRIPSLKQLERRLHFSPFSKEEQQKKLQAAKNQHNNATKYFESENIIGKYLDDKDQGPDEVDFEETIMRVQSRLFQLY